MQQCGAACGESGANLLKCSRCQEMFYCSKQCQKNHWKLHKPDCKVHAIADVGTSFMKERMGDTKWKMHSSDTSEKKENGINDAVEMNAMFERLLATGLPHPGGFDPIDLRIPPFHISFARRTAWPAGCSIQICKKRLLGAYEFARGAKMIFDTYRLQGHKAVDRKHLFRRLGWDYSNGTMDWFLKANVGDINANAAILIYNPTVIHSFSNAPSIQEVITPGSTIVSIGFVDLGILRESIFSPAFNTNSRPTRWIGYEASAYSVAKTAVIIAMLHDSTGDYIDCILQVWYSTAWSSKTLEVFQRAVNTLLEGRLPLSGIAHPDVGAILRVWQTAASNGGSVSLSMARSGWLKAADDVVLWRLIGNFTSEADRDAMCLYCITGQLLPATVGSVVMFAHPGLSPEGDHVFQSIAINDLLKRRNGGARDFTEAAIGHLRDGIKSLAAQVRRGSITMDVHLRAVEPNDSTTLGAIAALDPFTITWSNVCDYFQPKEFHDMARACSGSNTIHHAYSMNWPMRVKGAFALDFAVMDVGRDKLDNMLSAAHSTIQLIYNALQYNGLFLSPPVDDSRNIIDSSLQIALFDKWLRYFFQTAELNSYDRQVELRSPPIFSVLSRCCATFFFAFTYDPEIVFQTKLV